MLDSQSHHPHFLHLTTIAQDSVDLLSNQLYIVRSSLSEPNYDAFVAGELSAAVRAAAADAEEPQALLEALGDLFNNAVLRFEHWQQLVAAAGAGMAGRSLRAAAASEQVGGPKRQLHLNSAMSHYKTKK